MTLAPVPHHEGSDGWVEVGGVVSLLRSPEQKDGLLVQGEERWKSPGSVSPPDKEVSPEAPDHA